MGGLLQNLQLITEPERAKREMLREALMTSFHLYIEESFSKKNGYQVEGWCCIEKKFKFIIKTITMRIAAEQMEAGG